MPEDIPFKSVRFVFKTSKSIVRIGERAEVNYENSSIICKSLSNTSSIRFLGKIDTSSSDSIEYNKEKLFVESEEDCEISFVDRIQLDAARDQLEKEILGEIIFYEKSEIQNRFFVMHIGLSKNSYKEIYDEAKNDINNINEIHIGVLFPHHPKKPIFAESNWDLNKFKRLKIDSVDFYFIHNRK